MNKNELVEEIFDRIADVLDFHYRNADDMEDLKERVQRAIYQVKDEFIEENE